MVLLVGSLSAACTQRNDTANNARNKQKPFLAMSATTSDPTSGFSLDDLWVNPPGQFLWDFAGVDGLQGAIALFGPTVNHIAPFQSLTAAFDQQPCSVLRLCENNFRVALPVARPLDQAIAELGLKIWVKPCQTATLVLPTMLGLKCLAQIATTKPLYTLDPFPLDRAVPARINDTAILAWYHLWQGRPRLEVQIASSDLPRMRALLQASLLSTAHCNA